VGMEAQGNTRSSRVWGEGGAEGLRLWHGGAGQYTIQQGLGRGWVLRGYACGHGGASLERETKGVAWVGVYLEEKVEGQEIPGQGEGHEATAQGLDVLLLLHLRLVPGHACPAGPDPRPGPPAPWGSSWCTIARRGGAPEALFRMPWSPGRER